MDFKRAVSNVRALELKRGKEYAFKESVFFNLGYVRRDNHGSELRARECALTDYRHGGGNSVRGLCLGAVNNGGLVSGHKYAVNRRVVFAFDYHINCCKRVAVNEASGVEGTQSLGKNYRNKLGAVTKCVFVNVEIVNFVANRAVFEYDLLDGVAGECVHINLNDGGRYVKLGNGRRTEYVDGKYFDSLGNPVNARSCQGEGFNFFTFVVGVVVEKNAVDRVVVLIGNLNFVRFINVDVHKRVTAKESSTRFNVLNGVGNIDGYELVTVTESRAFYRRYGQAKIGCGNSNGGKLFNIKTSRYGVSGFLIYESVGKRVDPACYDSNVFTVKRPNVFAFAKLVGVLNAFSVHFCVPACEGKKLVFVSGYGKSERLAERYGYVGLIKSVTV